MTRLFPLLFVRLLQYQYHQANALIVMDFQTNVLNAAESAMMLSSHVSQV